MCPVGDVPGARHSSSSSQSTRPQLSAPATQRHPPEHRHITYFVIDMHQAGVEVRRLRDMTGRAHFNEVFLTAAVVAGVDVVGEVNDGWRVTLTTLANERNSLGANTQGGGGKLEIHGHDLTTPISELLARAASDADAPSAKVRGYHLLGRARPPTRGGRQRRGATGTGPPVQRSRHRGDLVAADVGRRRHSASRVASTLKLLTSHNLHRPARAALDV